MSRDITEAQRDWLTREVDAWRGLGLLTDDQARDVLALYPTREEAGRLRQSKALVALMALAALLVGLGVILLVAFNWEAMPAALKVAVILAGLAACHAAGLGLRFRWGLPGAAEAAFFLGCLIYGAGIWLIAQVFHVSAHYPDGLWWWAVGVLPFALALDTLLTHVLFVALTAAWAGTDVLGFPGVGGWFFGRWAFVPNAAYSLPVLAAPGIAWAYRKRSARALGLYVPLLAWWVVLQPFAWQMEDVPIYFIGAVGGLLLLASEMHPESSPLAIPYRLYGALLVAGVLVPLSYHGVNKYMIERFGPRGLGLGAGFSQLVMILVVTALTLAAVVAVRRGWWAGSGRGKPRAVAEDLAALARRQWLPCALVVVMAGLAAWTALGVEGALVPTVVANAAMVVFALWLMHVGLRSDRGSAFSAGVLYFLLWAVLRYIDLFGNFLGMLGAALMFFLCGVALFGVAQFWRRRKEVHLV